MISKMYKDQTRISYGRDMICNSTQTYLWYTIISKEVQTTLFYVKIEACASREFLTKRMEKTKKTSFSDDTFKKVVGVCFTQQMPASQGFKKFGEKALAVIIKELKQLNDGAMEGKPVVEPIDADILTDDDKKKALDAVNLIEKNEMVE
mmetsp:Transcript_11002/g.16106  ORF Transcript_11002/g.16106 Transcript_11002/m.16106 type:complete len:149 (+) Transcript_11002:1760-2206(+)